MALEHNIRINGIAHVVDVAVYKDLQVCAFEAPLKGVQSHVVGCVQIWEETPLARKLQREVLSTEEDATCMHMTIQNDRDLDTTWPPMVTQARLPS